MTARPRKVNLVKRATRGQLLSLLTIFVTLLLTIGLNVWYTNRVDRKSNQTWCDLMVSLDDRNRKNPPTDPDARRFAEQVSQIRHDLGCKEDKQ